MGPSPSVRKAVAGMLIRLAHRIYPPKVTLVEHGAIKRRPYTDKDHQVWSDDHATHTAGPMGAALRVRRVSRGWN